jgi:hypothetical protein
MMEFIKKITGTPTATSQKRDDFSDFFLHAKSSEKVKVIRQVIREATEEQKAVVKKYKDLRPA